MQEMLSGLTNVPEYSVSEISGAVRRTLEGAFGRVRVRGEITELKRYSSGHIYFALKDESAKICGVVWKSAAGKLGMVPENGVEIVATGRVTGYGERSSYQLIVERMEYAGAGALLARIEALRQRLLGEGLFDPERKRALPVLPRVVGVVSSPQGAVIQDIRTTIARRFPRLVLLWPVQVQGDGAAQKIAAAIRGFNELQEGFPRPDVLIVARGGGSLEDLMAFNEEVVVRAAAASRIPLISAVGHETDTTLIDFASDRRAPTPTAAAELAVPARAELLADLAQKAARLAGAAAHLAQGKQLRLHQVASGLPDPVALAGQARQRLDDRARRLELALPNLIAARRAGFQRVSDRLLPALRQDIGKRHAEAVRIIARMSAAPLLALVRERTAGLLGCGRRLSMISPGAGERAALQRVAGRLLPALRQDVGKRHAEAGRVAGRLSAAPLLALLRERWAGLSGCARQLESVSPLAVLARGYVLVTEKSGKPVTAAASIEAGQTLELRFHDGKTKARAL